MVNINKMKNSIYLLVTQFIVLLILSGHVQADDDYSVKGPADYHKFTDGVVVFDYDNFDVEVKKYKHILVEFYQPTCSHCIALLPAYHAAAKELSQLDPPIPLGVADVAQYRDFWAKFNIGGTPRLIWFVNGAQFDYTSGRSKE